MVKVFVSYSWADHAKVEPFVEQLRRPGLEVWMDKSSKKDQSSRKIDNFVRELRQALDAADAFLVFWSENYPIGSWAPRELDVITAMAIQNGKRLYCVPLDATQRSPFLMSQWSFDLSEAEAAASALLGPDFRSAGASSSPVGPPSRPLLDPSTPDLVIVGLAQEILERLARAPRDASGPIALNVDFPGGSRELRLTSGTSRNRVILDELKLCLEIFEGTARVCNATERRIADSLDPRDRTILEARLPDCKEELRRRAGRIREILQLIVKEEQQPPPSSRGHLLVVAGTVVVLVLGWLFRIAVSEEEHRRDMDSAESPPSSRVLEPPILTAPRPDSHRELMVAKWREHSSFIVSCCESNEWELALRSLVHSRPIAVAASPSEMKAWEGLLELIRPYVSERAYDDARHTPKPGTYPFGY